ncbi:MAG: class I SAM-dependent methyltransferase [Flammeovirgaceae bacterium]
MENREKGNYVQYGCGLSAPEKWINFDVSPTLRIQKLPIIGRALKNKLNTIFPKNVRYGDIIKGLPIDNGSCDGLYCSHTLEHLSLQDFRTALVNSYLLLKDGGIFRCVVPDLEFAARTYIANLENGDNLASLKFFSETLLGLRERPKDFKGILSSLWGNSHHLWMWDSRSLKEEMKKVGFSKIRDCKFNDCEDEMFQFVEDSGRFENAVALECRR